MAKETNRLNIHVGGCEFEVHVPEKHGYCPDFKGMREWNCAIQKMIDAFELMKYANTYSEDEKRTIEQGLDLFRKHFFNLWD